VAGASDRYSELDVETTWRKVAMHDVREITRGRDIRLENFAAELTNALYPLVLRREPTELWVNVELSLWRALTQTVETHLRQRSATASEKLEAGCQELVVDLTESAFSIAVKIGIKGSLRSLELSLYRAVRVAISSRRCDSY
jgi:hypothetical protein